MENTFVFDTKDRGVSDQFKVNLGIVGAFEKVKKSGISSLPNRIEEIISTVRGVSIMSCELNYSCFLMRFFYKR